VHRPPAVALEGLLDLAGRLLTEIPLTAAKIDLFGVLTVDGADNGADIASLVNGHGTWDIRGQPGPQGA
jgi:hypothetical protein